MRKSESPIEHPEPTQGSMIWNPWVGWVEETSDYHGLLYPRGETIGRTIPDKVKQHRWRMRLKSRRSVNNHQVINGSRSQWWKDIGRIDQYRESPSVLDIAEVPSGYQEEDKEWLKPLS